jgi:hypothetical protein
LITSVIYADLTNETRAKVINLSTMVKMNRRGKGGGWKNISTFVVGAVGILGITAWYNNGLGFCDGRTISMTALSQSIPITSIAYDADENAAEVKTKPRKHDEQSGHKTVEATKCDSPYQ